MKRSSLFGRLLFISLFALLFSCNKFDLDDILHHPDKVPQLCDIKRITSFRSQFIDTLIADFYYNKWDNPTSVRLNKVTTGQTEFLFRYDKNNRLSDFIQAYNNAPLPFIGYEGWTRVAWQGNRIIRDTLWGLGDSPDGINPSPNSANFEITSYDYDAYGRIIKATNVDTSAEIPQPPSGYRTYHYNNAGNLTNIRSFLGNGTLIEEIVYGPYDNKANILRTNKIWMFLQKDYSVNNRIKSLAYNKYGQPLKFQAIAGQRFIFLNANNYDIADSDIKYDCK